MARHGKTESDWRVQEQSEILLSPIILKWTPCSLIMIMQVIIGNLFGQSR